MMNIFKLWKKAKAIKRLLGSLVDLAEVMPEMEDVEAEFNTVRQEYLKAMKDGKITQEEQAKLDMAQAAFGGELLDVVRVALPIWKNIKKALKEITG